MSDQPALRCLITELLYARPRTRKELIALTGCPYGAVNTALVTLRARGTIVSQDINASKNGRPEQRFYLQALLHKQAGNQAYRRPLMSV